MTGKSQVAASVLLAFVVLGGLACSGDSVRRDRDKGFGGDEGGNAGFENGGKGGDGLGGGGDTGEAGGGGGGGFGGEGGTQSHGGDGGGEGGDGGGGETGGEGGGGGDGGAGGEGGEGGNGGTGGEEGWPCPEEPCYVAQLTGRNFGTANRMTVCARVWDPEQSRPMSAIGCAVVATGSFKIELPNVAVGVWDMHWFIDRRPDGVCDPYPDGSDYAYRRSFSLDETYRGFLVEYTGTQGHLAEACEPFRVP